MIFKVRMQRDKNGVARRIPKPGKGKKPEFDALPEDLKAEILRRKKEGWIFVACVRLISERLGCSQINASKLASEVLLGMMRKNQPIDNEDALDRIRKLYRTGMSRNDIATRLDMHPNTISKIANKVGIKFRKGIGGI